MKGSSAILSEKTDRENHNTTMGRNQISFLLSGSTILTSFSLKFAFHPSDKGLGSLQNVNCEEGTYLLTLGSGRYVLSFSGSIGRDKHATTCVYAGTPAFE